MRKGSISALAATFLVCLALCPMVSAEERTRTDFWDRDEIEIPLSDLAPNPRFNFLGIELALNMDLGNLFFDLAQGVAGAGEIYVSFWVDVFGLRITPINLIISDLIVRSSPLRAQVFVDAFNWLALRWTELSVSLMPFSALVSVGEFSLLGLPIVGTAFAALTWALNKLLHISLLQKALVKLIDILPIAEMWGGLATFIINSLSKIYISFDVVCSLLFNLDGEEIKFNVDPTLVLGGMPLSMLPGWGFHYKWPW